MKGGFWKSLVARHEVILLAVVIAEVLLFQCLGDHFLTAGNVGNIFRHSFEVGLLALVMTPIILTGGIDLSVGALLGLCGMVFGMLAEMAHLPLWLAGLCAVGLGALGGGINAALITILRLPPLIVTLGTFSLFRGLVEALVKVVEEFRKTQTEPFSFPGSFRDFGQTSEFLGLPLQLWLLAGAALAMWLLVHRTTFGRAVRAVGFAPEGARYAGLPVARRVATAYVLAGAVAGAAAVVLVARLGSADANAGNGYELAAITAVVLGGTSIFGGAGSVHGTLLGVLAIALLHNGLTRIEGLSDPEELSGMLTGALLLVALAAGALGRYLGARRSPRLSSSNTVSPS